MKRRQVDLRAVVTDALGGGESAYQLPAVCERYGLATGTSDEAMRSERAYVLQRLNPLPKARVLEVARAVAADHLNYRLDEAIAHHDEADHPLVSDLTRRRIARRR